MKERTSKRPHLCGWCAGAILSSDGVRRAHRRCHSPDKTPCACAEAEHKLTPKTAEVMALHCHTNVDRVYEGHGRKRRVVSDDQRAVLAERLIRAREAKETKQREAATA